MRTSLPTLVFVLTCVLQACSLKLQWTNPVHANEVVTLQWLDGVPPYTIGVYQYPDTLLTVAEYQSSGSDTWRVSVPQGTQIGFVVMDSRGADYAISSGWLVVQQDLAVASSSISAVSASAATALQSSMSVLSTSALRPTVTPTSTPSTQAQATIPVGPLVGGIVGGVAALLIFALLVFWLIRQSKSPSPPAVLPAVNPGYMTPMDKDAATLGSSQLPSTPYLPASAAPMHTTTYGGYPEVQNDR